MIPEKFKSCLEKFSILYNNEYVTKNNGDDDDDNDHDFSIFESFAEKNYNLAYNNDDDEITIDKLQNLIKSTNYIKAYEYRIPNGILPENKVGYLNDIHVNMTKKQKKEEIDRDSKLRWDILNGDDYIYRKNPEIQKNIPRGLTTLKITSNDNNNHIEFNDICIYSNKKFRGFTEKDDDDDGSNKDDDSRNNDNGDDYDTGDGSKLYFTKNPKYFKDMVIFMEKVNGDALHFSCRYLYNKYYLFVGSKTSHIMISDVSHIDLYTDSRYTIAKQFAKSLWKMLESMSKCKRVMLFEFLHYTKVTAVCEILQSAYQHVVHINNNENVIVFLSFTSALNSNNSLTAFPPHIAIKVMRILNITCANYKLCEKEEEKEEIGKSRNEYDNEGYVIYYLDKNNDTIGMIKLKTLWYIFLRALRQKTDFYFRNRDKVDYPKFKQSLSKRYDEIQKFVNITNINVNSWKIVGYKFIDWLQQQQQQQQIIWIQSKFPIFWKDFIEQEKINLYDIIKI